MYGMIKPEYAVDDEGIMNFKFIKILQKLLLRRGQISLCLRISKANC